MRGTRMRWMLRVNYYYNTADDQDRGSSTEMNLKKKIGGKRIRVSVSAGKSCGVFVQRR